MTIKLVDISKFWNLPNGIPNLNENTLIPTNLMAVGSTGTSVFMRGDATWATVSLTSGVSGILPVVSGGSGVATSTGTGQVVLSSGPVLATPSLGTPVSGVLTNCTGTAAGLTAGTVTTNANLTGHVTSVGNAAVLGSFTSAQLATALTDELGSGKAIFGASGTAWTPTGNNVTLTNNGSKYVQLGPVMFAHFDVTWPSTADTSVALVRSLPVVSAAGYGVMILGYTNYGSAITGLVNNTSSTAVDLYNLLAASLTNANLSTSRVIGTAVYFV